jgi:hypothetical protein
VKLKGVHGHPLPYAYDSKSRILEFLDQKRGQILEKGRENVPSGAKRLIALSGKGFNEVTILGARPDPRPDPRLDPRPDPQKAGDVILKV